MALRHSTETQPTSLADRGRSYRDILFRGGPFIALMVLCVFLSMATPYFATVDNMFNITRQSSFTAILAVGQTFVILTGGIDLSVAAVAALSASLSTVLLTSPLVLFGQDFGILPAPLSIAIGLLTGCACGVLNGWIIAQFKIPDFIATLGTMTVVRGVALIVTDGLPVPSFQASASGANLPAALIEAGSGAVFGIPISAIIAVIVALIGFYVLRYRALGRAIFAVGGNKEAARVAGIDIGRTKILAYMISGLTAAIAGLVMVGRLNSANALMAEGEELRSIAAVVIGGTNLFGGEGGVIGSMVGAVIIGVLNNGLNLLDVSPFWQRIAQGLVIVLVVIFDQWRRRRTSSER